MHLMAWKGSTLVELFTRNPKTVVSNPATGTGKDKVMNKVIVVDFK
jgi:hypothetical protein